MLLERDAKRKAMAAGVFLDKPQGSRDVPAQDRETSRGVFGSGFARRVCGVALKRSPTRTSVMTEAVCLWITTCARKRVASVRGVQRTSDGVRARLSALSLERLALRLMSTYPSAAGHRCGRNYPSGDREQ